MSRNDGRTEQPTARRLREARERGQIARSAEVSVAATLLAALLAGVAAGPTIHELWRTELTSLLMLDVAGEGIRAVVESSAARMLLVGIVPFLVAGTVATLAGGAIQVGVRLRPKAARPQLSRVSPRAGLQRLKPSTTLWELGRTVGKLALLTAVVWGPLQAWRTQVDDGWTFAGGLTVTGDVLASVILRTIGISVAVAAADYAWNRRKTLRELRMTKDEVKRESRDQLGDPLLRARRTERARQLSRNRMLADVAHADAVIVNPTHLAIALRYDPSEPAPRVIAKGADRLAARICAEARRHGVLITQDIPLARTLYRRVKPGDLIPSALFEAVAVVLATAYRRRGRPAVRTPAAAAMQ